MKPEILKLLSILGLLVLPGCLKQAFVVNLHEDRTSEARYYDLPIPIDSQPSFEDSEQGILARFKTQQSLGEIRDFYLAEMECFGWRLVTEYSGSENMLLFERPSRWVTVSIRPDGRGNMVSIISSNKEGSRDGEPL